MSTRFILPLVTVTGEPDTSSPGPHGLLLPSADERA